MTSFWIWRFRASSRIRWSLEQQVRRMLRDPRSTALLTNFAGQWLEVRNLPLVTPNEDIFPNFDENLRQAFRQETELFLESILREDRSVIDLLTADYTFVNERLARFYGIPDVYGDRFRRVTLDDEQNARAGILGQGSVLTVTSYANRTSPVLRGKWILSNLLGAPPPPPPPMSPLCRKRATTASGYRCARRWKRTARTRSAPAVTRAWTRLASRWRISTRSVNFARSANRRNPSMRRGPARRHAV